VGKSTVGEERRRKRQEELQQQEYRPMCCWGVVDPTTNAVEENSGGIGQVGWTVLVDPADSHEATTTATTTTTSFSCRHYTL
jgi:hypothetical protein